MFSEDDSDILCYGSAFVKVRLSEETDCFVGPVVLHEDILSSVLSSISKQHDDFIAVCSRDICLLKNTFDRAMNKKEQEFWATVKQCLPS